jgi:hypothetical protein
MRCKRLFLLVLLISAGCNLSSFPGDMTATALPDTCVQEWSDYHSDDLNFSIQYPAAWELRDRAANEGAVYFWSDEHFGGEVEPVVYYVYALEYLNPGGSPIADIASEGLPDDLKANLVFTTQTIGEYTAHIVEGLPSRSGSLTAFLTLDETRYIALGLTPYDSQSPWMEQERFLHIFEAMLATFEMS